MNNLNYLKYKTLKLSYLAKGTGPTGLVCFHGFGKSAEDFIDLDVTSEFKIISVNLPFHSESKFYDSDPKKTFSKEDLNQCIEQIIEIENIDNMFLIGYSLGGKAVLCTLESEKFNIKGTILFAPDGFKSNPWYWFASQTKLGESLNKLSIKNLWIFNSFLNFSKMLGFATERQLHFAKQQMNSVAKRELVYNIWRSHRKLNANLKKVSESLEKNKTPIRIILGKYDKIIPLTPIKTWSKKCTVSTLVEIKSGHEISKKIIEKHILELIQ